MNKIMRLNEFLAAEPTVKPTTRPTTAPPVTRPSRPIPSKRPGEREQGKPMATEPTTRPTTKPTIAPPVTRPVRPIPTKRPGEKEQGKPMATAKEVLDQFFNELNSIKDTSAGAKMIKKLHDKYAKSK